MDNRKARMLFLKRNKAYRISNRKWIAVLNRSGDNWSHNYADYWQSMCAIFKRLDDDSLLCAVRTRSQQKATFSQQGIAKVN